MDEFSQSRYRLESRYHHVLVDEFQDTSRLQWQLVSLLVQSWGEGFGLVHEAPVLPSLFIVGDRKQSIYRFRDADVTLLDEAASAIRGLRPGRRRAARDLAQLPRPAGAAGVRQRRLRRDRRPGGDAPRRLPLRRLGSLPDRPRPRPCGRRAPARTSRRSASSWPSDSEATAHAVAAEIARLLASGTVRDRDAPACRAAAAPGDIAILFRSRDAHREFERALEARGIPAYVYKGLGFFDADEIKDLVALIRFLAAPASDLRAAAFARSRLVALSDHALARLAPHLAAAFTAPSRRARRRRRSLDRGRRGAAGAGPRLAGRLAGAGRSLPAGRRPRSRARRLRLRRRAGRPASGAGARERQEAARPGAARQQPRLRDDGPSRRSHRSAGDRRRGQRRARGGARGQPDDRARVEGPRVPDRLRRQHRPRREPAALAGARPPVRRRRRSRVGVGLDRELPVRAGHARARAGARGDQAAALRRPDARPRSAVPVGGGQGGHGEDGAAEPRPVAAAVAAAADRGRWRRGPTASGWRGPAGRRPT